MELLGREVVDLDARELKGDNKIIKLCDGIDYVTQDMCIALLADEEQHRREFRGFLMEYEKS